MPADTIGNAEPAEGEVCTIVSTPWRREGEKQPLWPPMSYHPDGSYGQEIYLNWATVRAIRYTERKSGREKIGPRASNNAFCEQHFLMLDDIGTAKEQIKLPVAAMKRATYVIETSEGKFQVGFAFKLPIDADDNARLRAALIAAKYSDAGALGTPHRWCRIPGSMNVKPGRNDWRAALRQWQPEESFTLSQLCKLLQLDLDATITAPDSGSIATDDTGAFADYHWTYMQTLAKGSPGSIIDLHRSAQGFFSIICPWADEHTDTDEAGYKPATHDRASSFKCMHSHGEKYRTGEFKDWITAHERMTGYRDSVVVADTRIAAPVAATAREAPDEPDEDAVGDTPVGPVEFAPIIDWLEMARNPPTPKREILGSWLHEGTVCLFAGNGGVGKSFVGLQIAVKLALGIDTMGCKVQQERVLLYSCEDDSSTIYWRVMRICRDLGRDISELSETLCVRDYTDSDAIMYSDSRGGVKTDHQAMTLFKDDVRNWGATVAFIDNASDVFSGNEVVRAQVRQFVRLLKAQAGVCAVVLLAHVDKVSAKNPETSQGYSGSTAWNNSVRSRWYLFPEENNGLILELQKANYGKSGARLTVEYNEAKGVFEMGSAEGRDEVMEGEVLEGMKALHDSGINLPTAKTAPLNVKKQLIGAGVLPKSITWSRVDEVLVKLQQAGFIEAELRKGANLKTAEFWRLSPKGMAYVLGRK